MDDARIRHGARDAAECRRAEAAIWLSESRSVGQVKDLTTNFHGSLFGDLRVLDEREIEISIGRTPHWVARSGADSELRRRGKRGREEEFRSRSLIGGEVKGRRSEWDVAAQIRRTN